MQQLTNKIALFSIVFLITLMGFTYITYNKIAKENELQPAIETPVYFCGTNNYSSQKAKIGRDLFKANCASCHNLFKKMIGPSLRGLVQNNRYPSKKYFYDYVRNEQKLIDNNDEYVISINHEYNFN